jgi:hypothetical protein
MAAAASMGVTVKLALVVAPIADVAVAAAAAAALVATAVMAVDSTAVAAASAASVFLLRLPGGRPRLREPAASPPGPLPCSCF